jgi:hypothetical protein
MPLAVGFKMSAVPRIGEHVLLPFFDKEREFVVVKVLYDLTVLTVDADTVVQIKVEPATKDIW